MNTKIDFRYTYITPEGVRQASWNKEKTFLWNVKNVQKVIKKILVYNIETLTFQYQLLERLERKNEYIVIKQVQKDIETIEQRLNTYREFDKILDL